MGLQTDLNVVRLVQGRDPHSGGWVNSLYLNGRKINNCKDLSLAQWIELLKNPFDDEYIIDYCFPTDLQKKEFIKKINEWPEKDILLILQKFLLSSGSLGVDDYAYKDLIFAGNNEPERFERMIKHQYYQRLIYYQGSEKIYPWEGITWVIDLLPNSPKKALEALGAYIYAHGQLLPDNRLDGLWDAYEIIKARFIGFPNSTMEKIEFLQALSSREFEIVVERLYDKMGYATELTQGTRDGGKDIIAVKKTPGQQEQLRIECKKHNKTIGVEIARALLGVVSSEKVNKGVIVTTSKFSVPTKNFTLQNPRIELIDGAQLVLLLNEFSWIKMAELCR